MDFEWDPKKNEANIRKHGVAFSEAATVFSILSITADPDHSQEEDRYIIIGMSGQSSCDGSASGTWRMYPHHRELTVVKKETMKKTIPTCACFLEAE